MAGTPSDKDLMIGQQLDEDEPDKGKPEVEPEVESEEPEQEPETQDEPEADEEPEAPESDEDESAEDDKPLSPRQSKRLNQLLEKITNKAPEPSAPNAPTNQPSKEEVRKRLIDEGQYTVEQVNDMADEWGKQQYQAGVQASQNATLFLTRLEIDAPRVAQKYEVLNQNSPDFDPGRASFINELYLKTVGYDPNTGAVQNPNIRYEEFADGIMDLVQIQVAAGKADSQGNVRKQASKTGPRPGGAVKKPYAGTDPAKMTDEQLDAMINENLPSLRRR